jgi:hypothetical protein
MHKRPAITSDVRPRLIGTQPQLNAEQTNKKALGQRAEKKELQTAITLSAKASSCKKQFQKKNEDRLCQQCSIHQHV